MREKIFPRMILVGFVIFSLQFAGCAGRKVGFTVPEGGGEKTVALEASSFRFAPNAIEAHAQNRLLLQVHNSAGMEHNLTVEDPGGKIVLSFDLPAGKTTEGRISLEQTGEYHFYCDKPFHTSMGMKGTINVR